MLFPVGLRFSLRSETYAALEACSPAGLLPDENLQGRFHARPGLDGRRGLPWNSMNVRYRCTCDLKGETVAVRTCRFFTIRCVSAHWLRWHPCILAPAHRVSTVPAFGFGIFLSLTEEPTFIRHGIGISQWTVAAQGNHSAAATNTEGIAPKLRLRRYFG